MVMVMGSQLKLLLGGGVVASFSGLAACLLRRRLSAPRIVRRFEWPDQSLLAAINPHAEFHLLARDSNFSAALATPIQFGDYLYHALCSGHRLEFIFHDTRPTYAVWLFYQTLWAYSPTVSTSRQLGSVLQPSMQFIMICYIKDMEQLLLSLISAYYTAGPGMNNGSLNNSASIQILDIRIPRSTFLLVEEPAVISYSMWMFIRSVRAMRPGSTHSRSTALIPVTLLNPFDFVVVCVERLMHALLANLRDAAIQAASTSNRLLLVSQSGPLFEPELAPTVHYVIPLALARRFRLVPQGTTTISYSQWAFNLSLRARSPSQAPSSSALSVLLHSPTEFVWRCYGDWMITMLIVRARAINQMTGVVSPVHGEVVSPVQGQAVFSVQGGAVSSAHSAIVDLLVDQEVDGGSSVVHQDQPNNSAQFIEMFMRAAAAANLPIRNSAAVVGPTNFAPHHLLDPAMRASLLRASSIVAGDSWTGEIGRGGCVAPVSQTPSQDRRPLLPSLQPQPCLIRQGPGSSADENDIGTKSIILGLSGGSYEGKASSTSHGDYAKGPNSAMGPHFVSGGFEVKPDGSMGCLNWGSTSDQSVAQSNNRDIMMDDSPDQEQHHDRAIGRGGYFAPFSQTPSQERRPLLQVQPSSNTVSSGPTLQPQLGGLQSSVHPVLNVQTVSQYKEAVHQNLAQNENENERMSSGPTGHSRWIVPPHLLHRRMMGSSSKSQSEPSRDQENTDTLSFSQQQIFGRVCSKPVQQQPPLSQSETPLIRPTEPASPQGNNRDNLSRQPRPYPMGPLTSSEPAQIQPAQWTAPTGMQPSPAQSSFILPTEAARQCNNRDKHSRQPGHQAARRPYPMGLPSSSSYTGSARAGEISVTGSSGSYRGLLREGQQGHQGESSSSLNAVGRVGGSHDWSRSQGGSRRGRGSKAKSLRSEKRSQNCSEKWVGAGSERRIGAESEIRVGAGSEKRAGTERRVQTSGSQRSDYYKAPFNNNLGKELLIDSVISNSALGSINVGRALERWAPDEDDMLCLESLEQSRCGSSTTWDQFATNKALFGVQTTYDEHLYTTKIVSGPHTRELELRAARLAREIQGEDTSDMHMAEERGKEILNNEIDEEMRYSAVTR